MHSFGQTIGSMTADTEPSAASEAITSEIVAAMLNDMPLRAFISIGLKKISQMDV